MPYRLFQGKEVRTSDLLVLPRGEIFVDLETLEVFVGDGATPGGIPLQSASTGTGTTEFASFDGGGSATVFDVNRQIDGGSSNAVYDNSQLALDGGTA